MLLIIPNSFSVIHIWFILWVNFIQGKIEISIITVFLISGNTYQVTRKFIKCRNAETRTDPAIRYTACYKLAFFFFKRHTILFFNLIIHYFSVCWVVCLQSIIFKGEYFLFNRVGKANSFANFGLWVGNVQFANVLALRLPLV